MKAKSESKKPRPQWRRKRFWIPAILLFLWVDLLSGGWFYRWAGSSAIEQVLARRGWESSFQLGGSLWRGPTLTNITLRGAKDTTDFKADHVSLRYRLTNAFNADSAPLLQQIDAQRLTGILDLSQSKKKQKKDPYKFLRLLIMHQPGLSVATGDLDVVLRGNRTLSLSDFALTLTRNQSGRARWQHLRFGQKVDLPPHDGGATYLSNALQLTDLAYNEHIIGSMVKASLVEENDIAFDLTASLYKAPFTVHYHPGSDASLQLLDGSIPLADIFPHRALGGNLHQVTLDVASMKGPWRDWELNGTLSVEQPAWQDYKAEQMTLKLNHMAEEWEDHLAIQLDGTNSLNIKSTISAVNLGPSLKNWPATFHLDAKAPSLEAWSQSSSLPVTLTSLLGSVSSSWEDGSLKQLGGSLILGETQRAPWRLPPTTIDLTTEATEHPFAFAIKSDQGGLVVNGGLSRDLATYNTTAMLEVGDPSIWQLPNPETKKILGAGTVSWSGSGTLKGAHTGQVQFQLDNLQLAEGSPSYLGDGALSYNEQKEVELNRLHWQMDQLHLETEGTLAANGLHLNQLTLRQGDDVWLNGEVHVPLAADGDSLASRFWNAEEEVNIDLHSIELPVTQLVKLAGIADHRFTGIVKLDATVKGRAKVMEGDVTFSGKEVGQRSENAAIPLTADMTFHLAAAEQKLHLEGSIEHPKLKPITIEASLPFQFDQPNALTEAPIEARLICPPSDLAFLAGLTPLLRKITGTLAADLRLDGTVNKPRLHGEIDLNAPSIEFKDRDTPHLTDTRLTIAGDQAALTIKQGQFWFAGGKTSVSGEIKLEDLTNPVAALRVEIAQGLITRNENMILRADGDLKLEGPLRTAKLSGEIGIVQSRYFHDIELIPTNHPTKSLPSSPFIVRKSYGTKVAPLSDWNVNVRLFAKEPFTVKSNLATASIDMDLRLSGKGNAILPVGYLRFTNAIATLPFSKLNLGGSEIRFTRDTGFPGALAVKGHSRIRDHNVGVLVTGNLNEFNHVLTSSPPLGEEEILALLGTGVTRDELISGNQVAASRAAVLLFDRIWRKLSKDKWQGPSIMRDDRLTLEPGAVDGRTGKATPTVKLRLTDLVEISGATDIEGNIRGLISLLYRF